MWMKRLVTLSNEWKTSEFRQVTMALASGPAEQTRVRESVLAMELKRDNHRSTHCEQIAGRKEDGVAGEDPHPDEVEEVDICRGQSQVWRQDG